MKHAVPAKLMAAVLQSVRPMRLFTANPTDISVDHLLLRDGKGLNEVHKIVKSFLDVERTALQKKSLAIILEFNHC